MGTSKTKALPHLPQRGTVSLLTWWVGIFEPVFNSFFNLCFFNLLCLFFMLEQSLWKCLLLRLLTFHFFLRSVVVGSDVASG